jgi:hypothetical protein
MRKLITGLVALILLTTLFTPTYASTIQPTFSQKTQNNDIHSERKPIEDLLLASNKHPHYSLLAASIACWYTKPNFTGLKPILLHKNGVLSENNQRFLNQYLSNPNDTLLILGTPCSTTYPTTTLLGSPSKVSIAAATHTFQTSSHVLLLSDDLANYQLNLHATPLASYLNIPLVFIDTNNTDIAVLCEQLNVSTAIIIGNQTIELPGINLLRFATIMEIQQLLISTISTMFSAINYLTITNPSDIKTPPVISINKTDTSADILTTQLTLLGKTITLRGTNHHTVNITVPEGYQQIDIQTTCAPKNKGWSNLFKDHPLISLKLYDPAQQLIAYSSSQAETPRHASVQTFSCNHSGTYQLQLQLYHGFKGGYFSLRGLSRVNTAVTISTQLTTYSEPYIPPIQNLSSLAPYLTAAHGGIVIANTNFSLIDTQYQQIAQGTAAGPWYTEKLQNHSNEKVHTILTHVNQTLSILETNQLLESYLSGPAWLALLGDTQMLPMYYYQPSQPGIPEKGLPSDNPYSLNNNLSVGRIMSWNIQDTAVLLARTFFYEIICGQPTEQESWHNRFSFIFGEGFGETGGIFHQIPYARKLRQYDFDARVYGDLRNSRQLTTMLETYVGANYIEYLGHGDWFWFTPSLYGLDIYSKAIDVAHVRNWIFEKPSVFLSSACLMGRVDGIGPTSAIGLTFLHAGCNAFIGATRETGSEAGLETMEDLLIIDNFSIGEALRGEKQVDQELPTYYVRVLFGDPAFNPYEPLNGFSNQGTPILH